MPRFKSNPCPKPWWLSNHKINSIYTPPLLHLCICAFNHVIKHVNFWETNLAKILQNWGGQNMREKIERQSTYVFLWLASQIEHDWLLFLPSQKPVWPNQLLRKAWVFRESKETFSTACNQVRRSSISSEINWLDSIMRQKGSSYVIIK